MDSWVSIVGSLATVAFVLVSVALMLQAITSAQAIKMAAAVVVLTILIILLPALIINAWSGVSIREKLVACIFVALAIVYRLYRRTSQNKP